MNGTIEIDGGVVSSSQFVVSCLCSPLLSHMCVCEFPLESMRISLSLNYEGNILAIGSPGCVDLENFGEQDLDLTHGGFVSIWKLENNQWVPFGNKISAVNISDNPELIIPGLNLPWIDYGHLNGYSIELNKDGDRICIGSPGFYKDGFNSMF